MPNHLAMRYLPASALFIALLATACAPSDPPAPALRGTYNGTFQRQDAAGNGPVSRVSLVFSDSTWTGESQTAKYPALCRGTYKVNGTKVIFANACFWTAEFDWTLILSKEYKLKVMGEELELSRENSSSRDVYRLKLQ